MFIRMPNEVILLLQHFSALRVLSGAQPLGLLHVFGRTSFWIGQVFPPQIHFFLYLHVGSCMQQGNHLCSWCQAMEIQALSPCPS